MSTTNHPKVSVCVITYNHERYLEQCLQSIVEQETDFPFEVIVSDDCSKDGTRAIVESFARRYPSLIRPLLQSKNLGGNLNYLTVHRSARGEITSHCDGDDFWHPGKLQAQVDFLAAHAECVAVFTNSNVIAEKGDRLGTFSSGVPETFDMSFLVRRGNFLNHSSMMYRSAFRSEMHPESLDFIDMLLYIRLARLGKFGYIDKPYVSYRDQSVSSAIRADNAGIRLLYWQALCAVDERSISIDAIREARARFLASAAQRELRYGSWAGFRKWSDLVADASRNDFARVRARALGFALEALSGAVARRAASFFRMSQPSKRVYYPR